MATATEQKIQQKLDLVRPKQDSADLLARLEAVERAVEELKRRG